MSPRFDLVKHYYDTGRWNEQMVRNAVGRWITEEECELILNGDTSNQVQDEASVARFYRR